MRLYALDLFSGIGGNSIGLKDYVHTIAYCEADRHAQAVLLSRMVEGNLSRAPICTDVNELDGRNLRGFVDIIVAGFPCQDISVAGKGAGLEGERSGLFFQVMRLAKEIQPAFLFLENVPAIRTRGLDTVVQELTEAGYDCRWTMLSAAEVGAPHKRERWFMLAYSNNSRRLNQSQQVERSQDQVQLGIYGGAKLDAGHSTRDTSSTRNLADPNSPRLEVGQLQPSDNGTEQPTVERGSWWAVEPNVGRVAHGVPCRVERIKRLGNAVVPLQAKTAFEILMGIT